MSGQHPPVGTYPPDETTGALQPIPWQPPPPQEPKPVKKVGTLTVAIGLIAVGVLMIARLVFPGLNYGFIARLSPLLLIAYGAEVLVASALHRDKQIKYDLVGLVVSVILICTSLVAAALPEAISINREHTAAQQRLRDELNSISYTALKNAGIEVAELDWYIEPAYYNNWDGSITLNEIDLNSDYLQVRIRFAEDFTDEASFASACRQALDTMGVYAQNADYAIFYSNNYETDELRNGLEGTARYGLWLENNYQVNYTAGQITDLVEGYYWVQHHGWMPRDEYEYYMEYPEEFFDMDELDEPDYDEYDEEGDYDHYEDSGEETEDWNDEAA